MHTLTTSDLQAYGSGSAYGDDAARALAKYAVNKAIHNNDNYMVWLSGMWQVQLSLCGNFEPFYHAGKKYVFNKATLKYKVE